MMEEVSKLESITAEQGALRKRGFAAMTPEMRQAIAAKGGKAVHEQGKAYKFNSETARKAGRVGGNSVSENREHMAAIGRKGGEASCRAKGYNLIVMKDRENRGHE